MKKILPSLTLLLIIAPLTLSAQQVGIKTNVLYWATTTPNLGAEIALGPKLTLDLAGAYNPFRFGSKESNKKIQHWLIRPEVRFWPYERWDGHFLGVHGLFSSYNAGGVDIPILPLSNMKNNRYEGYATGVGFTYGYQWFLGPHWNLEATVGVAYMYLNYERYECQKCGNFIERTHKHWFGPTNVGVSFVYLIKSGK